MWLLHYVMERPSNAALSSTLKLEFSKSSKHQTQNGLSFSYSVVFNHLLATNAIDDVVVETESDINGNSQDSNVAATVYSNALLTKVLRCGKVDDESQLNGIFIELLLQSMHHIMFEFWGRNKKGSKKELARHADSLRCVQVRMTQAAYFDWQFHTNSNKIEDDLAKFLPWAPLVLCSEPSWRSLIRAEKRTC